MLKLCYTVYKHQMHVPTSELKFYGNEELLSQSLSVPCVGAYFCCRLTIFFFPAQQGLLPTSTPFPMGSQWRSEKETEKLFTRNGKKNMI